jgi:hypothetical protein
MNGEPASFAAAREGSELAFHPRELLVEQDRSLIPESAVVFVQFGAQAAHRATALGECGLVCNDRIDAGAEPVFWKARSVKRFERSSHGSQKPVQDRVADIVFGLEVIVDVSQWNVSLSGYVGNSSLTKATTVSDSFSGADEPRSTVFFLAAPSRLDVLIDVE